MMARSKVAETCQVWAAITANTPQWSWEISTLTRSSPYQRWTLVKHIGRLRLSVTPKGHQKR